MLHFKYIPLFSVTFTHNYYSDKVAGDFDFKPFPQTSSVLESFGLRAKNVDGKLVVFQQLESDGLPSQEIDAITDLYFSIRVRTDLLNITAAFGRGRFWFSNLKENGSYQNVLTSGAETGPPDELPEVSTQQKQIQFLPGTLASISIQKLKSPGGWTEISNTNVDPQAGSFQLDLNHPGLYRIEKHLVAGGKEQLKLVMSNEIAATGDYWSILHLQLKPGDNNLNFSIDLKPRPALWQYFLVEPTQRFGNNTININDLSLKYVASTASRYPANQAIKLTNPNAYSIPMKQYVAAIKAGGKVRSVYFFEKANDLEVLDGEQPQVKIVYQGQDLAENIGIPMRNKKDNIILYKL